MKSRIIAAVAAGAVALSTALATPAAAWSEREQNALAAILGALAVGAIINDLDKDNNKRRHPPRNEPVRARVIPGECVYQVRTNRGMRDVVSPRCMDEFGLAHRLPAECAFDVRVKGKNRTVYGPRCLGQYGWRVGEARY